MRRGGWKVRNVNRLRRLWEESPAVLTNRLVAIRDRRRWAQGTCSI